jgi:ABC-type Na+ efflux pump permease subunit
MAKTICKLLGVVFLLVGLCGFVAPGLMGTHLSTLHNIVHLASGAIALYLGFSGTLAAARMFCLVFGAVYLLLGVLGFVLGGAGTTAMAGMSPDPNLWKLLPGQLEFGRMDHIIHVLLGIIFLIGGFMTKADVRD